VPYGDANWLKQNGCSLGVYGWSGLMFGFAHLYNVERGKSDNVWSADWALKNADGLHLRLTVPEAQGADVAVCDGTSPAGGKPYEMKWVMLHRKAEAPAKSQIVSLIEPYVKEPIIKQAQPLALSGADEGGFSAAGCVVHLADRTDTILASADPTVERTAEGNLRFAGRFGFYAEANGEPVAMSLIGGTRLSKGEFGVTLASPEYRAKITKVDRATETVTVSPAPPSPAAMVGAHVFLTSLNRRSAYEVLEAKAVTGGVELRLDLDSRIGTGRVTGVEDFRVKTSTPFPLNRYRYYHGARLVNASGTAEYRLIEARHEAAALLDPQAAPDAKAAKLARDFPSDSWFDVYDYGVGDELVWPYVVTVERINPGVYRVTAPVPVTLSLPQKGA
jgi:hypothetical protein